MLNYQHADMVSRIGAAAVLLLTLSACSYLNIDLQGAVPIGNTTLVPAGSTTVTITGENSLSHLTVQRDGTDVSSQVPYVTSSTDQAQGQIDLPVGNHTITATAQLYCWYCNPSQYQATASKGTCAFDSSSTANVTHKKIPQSLSDNKSFADEFMTSTAPAQNPTVEMDTGGIATQWEFSPFIASINNPKGIIQSVGRFPCMCLASPDNNPDSQLVLAPCDINDDRQQWIAFVRQSPNGKGFFTFENAGLQNAGGGFFDCLTETASTNLTTLTQSSCGNANVSYLPSRLWSLRNVQTGQFETLDAWE